MQYPFQCSDGISYVTSVLVEQITCTALTVNTLITWVGYGVREAIVLQFLSVGQLQWSPHVLMEHTPAYIFTSCEACGGDVAVEGKFKSRNWGQNYLARDGIQY